MNRKIFLVFSLLILLSTITKSQTLKLGFRVEPAFFFIEEKNSSSIGFTPYNVYITTLIEPVEGLNLELRPGYSIGDVDYMGFEIGGFVRYNFVSKFYLITGLNNHTNSRGLGHNHGAAYEKNMLFKCIGIGYQKDSKLGFDLSYYWTDNKEFGDSWTWLPDGGQSPKIIEKMNGIIKLGFSLAWDIF